MKGLADKGEREEKRRNEGQKGLADMNPLTHITITRKLAGYSESRTYTRRAQKQEESGSDTQPKARRTVWRKANGAEVGQVMLRRIEGNLPMTGAPTRRMRGGGVDRAAGNGRGNEVIT